MKTFSEYLTEDKKNKELSKRLSSKSAVYLFKKDDHKANILANALLKEGRTYELSRDWSCRFDRAHVPKQQDHYHFLHKGNEICTVNRDGSSSHSSDLSQLPKHVRTDFEAKFNILIEDVEVLVDGVLGIFHEKEDAESIKILLEGVDKIIADL